MVGRGGDYPPRHGEDQEKLADLAERAARLAKADLVTGMVGEFPELQGLMGGYYAAAQGEHPAVAEAIRDHYKPVGQGDEVPTAPVTVAVSLADKLDTIVSFFAINEKPTGSRDPFALRRAALGLVRIAVANGLRLELRDVLARARQFLVETRSRNSMVVQLPDTTIWDDDTGFPALPSDTLYKHGGELAFLPASTLVEQYAETNGTSYPTFSPLEILNRGLPHTHFEALDTTVINAFMFISDRIAESEKHKGMRSDLVRAVIPREIVTLDIGLSDTPLLFAARKRNWGSIDSPSQIIARVRALQAFVGTEDGANLLAGYKRAANILKKEGYSPLPLGEGQGAQAPRGEDRSDPADAALTLPPLRGSLPLPEGEGFALSYTPEPCEAALIAALDSAEPAAASSVAREDFEGAMAALASLRAPIDAFFDTVTVNDPEPAKRAARLQLLARVRAAVHGVADFSRIEG